MKISSLKNLFAVVLLAGAVLTAAPFPVMAGTIETGNETQTDGSINRRGITDEDLDKLEANNPGIKDIIKKLLSGDIKGATEDLIRRNQGNDFIEQVKNGEMGTYPCEDVLTGQMTTCEAVILATGEVVSTEGNQKGCKPLPIKLVEDRECLFCPLFKVLFDAANTMSTTSFEKLAEPFSIVMLIGFAIWIALKVIAHVSSLTKQDAPKFLVGLINESFKVMLAYLLLTNAHAIYEYAISPILGAGLEFGSAVLFNTDNFADCAAAAVGGDGTNLLPDALYTKLDCFIKAIQKEIAYMQAVGSTLMCVGRHEGKIMGIIWDFGMVFQGLILYVFALVLSLAFAFYLIDATVQLGIVGTLMPMLIACWPFGPTRKYTSKGWEMFLNTFFTYVFLGIVISVNMQLVGQAMTNSGDAVSSISNPSSPCNGQTGLKALACVINNSDMDTLKKMTDLGFGGFLILLCCCIFGFKFTSSSTTLANGMASGGVSGIGNKIGGLAASGVGSLAAKATKPARDAVSRVGRKVADGTGRAIGSGAKMVGSAIASSKAGRAVKSAAGSGLATAANVAGKALGVHRGADGKGTPGANRKTKNNPLARQMVAKMLMKSRQLKGQSGSGTRGGGN